MNTHEEYVTYAQANALKELGFDWPCRRYATQEDAPDGHYWNCIPETPLGNVSENAREFAIPTQSVACRWLREEKGLVISLQVNNSLCDWKYSVLEYEDGGMVHADRTLFSTYESALSAGIDCALQLLKGNGNV